MVSFFFVHFSWGAFGASGQRGREERGGRKNEESRCQTSLIPYVTDERSWYDDM